MGVCVIISKCSYGANKEGSLLLWAVATMAQGWGGHHVAQGKDGHQAWPRVPRCAISGPFCLHFMEFNRAAKVNTGGLQLSEPVAG